MRKILLSLIIGASISLAQNSDPLSASVEVSISANIREYLETITLNNIDVGTIQPSQQEIRLNPRLDQGAGLIQIRGSAGTDIRVSFTQQVEMVNSTTNHIMTVYYSLSGNDVNEQNSSSPIADNPTEAILNSRGEYFIWIGCYFSLDGVTPGQYDGDFVIEVEAN